MPISGLVMRSSAFGVPTVVNVTPSSEYAADTVVPLDVIRRYTVLGALAGEDRRALDGRVGARTQADQLDVAALGGADVRRLEELGVALAEDDRRLLAVGHLGHRHLRRRRPRALGHGAADDVLGRRRAGPHVTGGRR